ncbi:MAG: ABC transporter ATP-binding protein, partial [Clostridia bacterium]|nr:ABC transporter ATP-binding protein [Clostridia bacterium]
MKNDKTNFDLEIEKDSFVDNITNVSSNIVEELANAAENITETSKLSNAEANDATIGGDEVADKTISKSSKKPKKEKSKPRDHIIKRLILEVKRIRVGVMVGCLLAAMVIVCNMLAPYVLSDIINNMNNFWLKKQAGVTGTGLLDSIYNPLVTLIVLYCGVAVFSYLKMLIMNNVVSKHFTCALRIDMSDKIARVPVSFVDKTQTGEVLSRMTNDVSIMGNTVHNVVDVIIMGILQIVAIAVMMFIVNWELALIVIAIIPMSVVLASILGKRSGKSFEDMFEKGGKLYSCVEETYGGYMTIKAYNLEKAQEALHAEINDKILEAEKKAVYISSIVQPIIAFTNSLAYIFICLLGGYFAISGKLTIGGVVAIVLYAKQFSSP